MLKRLAAACALLIAVPAFAQENVAGTQQQNVAGTQQEKQARVRVINALPTAQNVSVTLGGQQLFQNVQHKQVTEFKPITATDTSNLQITGADGNPLNTSMDGSLENDNNYYTLLIMASEDDNQSQPKVKVLKTDAPDNENQDKAEISLINASREVKAADLLLGDNRVHAGVNPGGINGKDEIETGAKQVRVFDGRERQDIHAQSMNFEPGQRYTAVVFGKSDALIIDDAKPQVAGGAGATGAAAGGASQDQTVTTPGAAPAMGATSMSAGAAATGAAGDLSTSPSAAVPGRQGMTPSDSASQNLSGAGEPQSHNAPANTPGNM